MSQSIPQEKKTLLRRQLEGLPPALVEDHLERLGSDYFHQFTANEVRQHLEWIALLQETKNCHVTFQELEDQAAALTVVGFDQPGLFAILCGLLTLAGFNIRSGHIFTYCKEYEETPWITDVKKKSLYERKKFIDFLILTRPERRVVPEEDAEELEFQLSHYLKLRRTQKYQEVRYQLHKRIGNYLASKTTGGRVKMLPVDIKTETDRLQTLLHIEGEDTPAFLYSLANALTLKEMNIHEVHIETDKNKVNDRIAITDRYDRPITDSEYLAKLKVAILLIKQFTLFLPFASDSDQAMRQFDLFLDELMSDKRSAWSLFDLEEANILALFASVFGAGSFLCEQFTKMQFRTLSPLFQDIDQLQSSKTADMLHEEINAALQEIKETPEKIAWLNRFKDLELFRIDLAHLVYPGKTFIHFAEELTDLAEVIVCHMFDVLYQELCSEFGEPRVHDKTCRYAIIALGKFGGREMGYASDIELLCIYEEGGYCADPNQAMTNGEFFNLLVQRFKKGLQVKEDGIFNVDLRLRPHGNAGTLASSLKRWIKYYENPEQALDFERQALIKMRPIHGEPDFSRRLLEERDHLIYGDKKVSIQNALELRRRQIEELVRPGTRNAKYSRGGLVDVEYAVQFLQLQYGAKHHELRHPSTIRALETLLELGCITPGEFETAYNGYAFQRRLINALRMVRGNAQDLVIPQIASDEFEYLARRLSYIPQAGRDPAAQLDRDIVDHYQNIASFFQYRFEGKTSEKPMQKGLPDLYAGEGLDTEERLKILARYPFQDLPKMDKLLGDLYRDIDDRSSFIAVLVVAFRHLNRAPDPDVAMIHFDRYLRRAIHQPGILQRMLFHPRYLELLVLLFGTSSFLSERLIQEPELLDFFIDPVSIFGRKTLEMFNGDLEEQVGSESDLEQSIDRIRQFRNRELIRIGLRDIYLDAPLEEIVRELSNLSDVILEQVCTRVFKAAGKEDSMAHQAVVALGKLGGRELNYSSDVDLVFVNRNRLETSDKEVLLKLNNQFIRELMKVTARGQLFRVDTTLRPYGTQGGLIASTEHYLKYFDEDADGWEFPVWLKARSVAGNLDLGDRLIHRLQDKMLDSRNGQRIKENMIAVRKLTLERLNKEKMNDRDVKSGLGGLRSIEFFVQLLQVQHGHDYPEILSGNTLKSLENLHQSRLLSAERYRELKQSYVFLRKIEHRLQMKGLQQRHLLPDNNDEMHKLALCMGYVDRLNETALEQFTGMLQKVQSRTAKVGADWLEL